MLARLSHTRLLRFAGLFTWAMAFLPLLYSWIGQWRDPAPDESVAHGMPWEGWACYLAFGIGYWWLTRGLGQRRQASDHLVLAITTLAAIGLGFYSESGLGSVLLMVAACVLPWLLPLKVGVVWLIAAQFAVVPVFMLGLHFPLFEALMQSLLYAGISGFVFITSLIALQQSEAREEQRRLNAELRSTRALLAESARVNERTRISRELHDLLGHHLTALSLNLEVAGHLSEGRVKEHVQQAHTLARLLLTDVREAVSQLRDSGSIDLGAALRPLAENLPKLVIHMDIQQPLTVDDPERAHVLLRCAQEAITNAVRQANAHNLWLQAHSGGHRISLQVRDDGGGTDEFANGNGLQGMRERLRQLGGRLEIQTRAGDGFQLTMTLPAGATADSGIPEGVAA